MTYRCVYTIQLLILYIGNHQIILAATAQGLTDRWYYRPVSLEEPLVGLEPTTHSLQNCCSTSWAKAARLSKGSTARVWAGRDSNPRRRKPTGLQPVPFDRFGTDPRIFFVQESHTQWVVTHGIQYNNWCRESTLDVLFIISVESSEITLTKSQKIVILLDISLKIAWYDWTNPSRQKGKTSGC